MTNRKPGSYMNKHIFWTGLKYTHNPFLGPVVQSYVSANPELKFNPCIVLVCVFLHACLLRNTYLKKLLLF
jgi:hypothetical protein